MTELPKLNADVSNIIKLDDLPNDKNGMNLSPDEFKARFDKAPEDIKQYLNEVLLPFLGGVQGASAIGVKPISGISEAIDVQTALELLKFAIDNTATGSIPDGSLGGEKLRPKSITKNELANACVDGDIVEDASLGDEKIINLHGSKIDKESIPSEAYGKLTVKNEHLADGSVDGGKVKEGSLVAKNYAPGSVQEPAIQKGAVTKHFVATFPASGWTGDAPPYTNTVAVPGMLAEDRPHYDIICSDNYDTAMQEEDAWAYVYKLIAAANSATLYAKEKATIDCKVQMEVHRK